MFTSTGDTGLLTLTITLQFMVFAHEPQHCTLAQVCAEMRLQGGHRQNPSYLDHFYNYVYNPSTPKIKHTYQYLGEIEISINCLCDVV